MARMTETDETEDITIEFSDLETDKWSNEAIAEKLRVTGRILKEKGYPANAALIEEAARRLGA